MPQDPRVIYPASQESEVIYPEPDAGGGGGALSDGDYGDITVSGSGTVMTIDNNVVDFAQMQNIATSRLLGRSTAGSGDIEELLVGSGLSLAAGTLSATASYTDEQAQDAVGNIFVPSSQVTFVYNDGVPSISASIVASSITLASLQDITTARILGRDTAGTGVVEQLTGAETTALLSNFVGDSGAGGTKGLVPAPSTGDATKFLRGDATWVTVASGGDVVGPVSVTDNAVVRWDGTGGDTIKNSGVIIDNSDNVTGMATLTLPNAGLHLLDTNASHDLIVVPGSDLSSDRTLTIVTGDSNRSLTLTGDTSLTGTNTGDQTITLTGDVTGSGTGSFAATIANDAVTYAKMQDVSAASRLLGRGSAGGSGNVEELTLGTGLSLTGTVLSSTVAGGMSTAQLHAFVMMRVALGV
jgi:hypothetical protein